MFVQRCDPHVRLGNRSYLKLLSKKQEIPQVLVTYRRNCGTPDCFQGSPIQPHHRGASGNIPRARPAGHAAAERQPHPAALGGRLRRRSESACALPIQKSHHPHSTRCLRQAAAARATLPASQSLARDSTWNIQRSAGAGEALPS